VFQTYLVFYPVFQTYLVSYPQFLLLLSDCVHPPALTTCSEVVDVLSQSRAPKPYPTALHFAAGDGTPALVALLLSKGLKADVQDKDGVTPVDMAEEEEHEEALELLKASL
jgi:hypothetical protein